MTRLDEEKIDEIFASNKKLEQLYPEHIQQLSEKHWTPLGVAYDAAAFLCEGGDKAILDIGSGAGKFCIAGAFQYSDCDFYGIEQRKELVRQSNALKSLLQLDNVHFSLGSFEQIDFNEFDGFYFYNSFYENIATDDLLIDEIIPYSNERYEHLTTILCQRLDGLKSGTRLATYHCADNEWPDSYKLVKTLYGGLLQLLQKI